MLHALRHRTHDAPVIRPALSTAGILIITILALMILVLVVFVSRAS